MKLEIDGVIESMQPDSVNWEPPKLMGEDGLGAPVYAPYWRCRLGFSRTSVVQFHIWYSVVDGSTHVITLPHPITGVMTDFTCYVSLVSPRMDVRDPCGVAVVGADITLSRIQVT